MITRSKVARKLRDKEFFSTSTCLVRTKAVTQRYCDGMHACANISDRRIPAEDMIRTPRAELENFKACWSVVSFVTLNPRMVLWPCGGVRGCGNLARMNHWMKSAVRLEVAYDTRGWREICPAFTFHPN